MKKHIQLEATALYKQALLQQNCQQTKTGILAINTGKFKGSAPI